VVVLGTAAVSVGVAITLWGLAETSVTILYLGSLIAGLGFGAAFSGSMRALMPTAEAHQRAGLLSTLYVLSYLAFSLPSVAAGLMVPKAGLATVAYVYGVAVIVLAVMSMAASLWSSSKAR
jgi:hypothetical protein